MRRQQNQKYSRKLFQSQHLFKSPRGSEFILSRLNLLPPLRDAVRLHETAIYFLTLSSSNCKLTQLAGQEAPFEKHFWSFSYPPVVKYKLHWQKVLYCRKANPFLSHKQVYKSCCKRNRSLFHFIFPLCLLFLTECGLCLRGIYGIKLPFLKLFVLPISSSAQETLIMWLNQKHTSGMGM